MAITVEPYSWLYGEDSASGTVTVLPVDATKRRRILSLTVGAGASDLLTWQVGGVTRMKWPVTYGLAQMSFGDLPLEVPPGQALTLLKGTAGTAVYYSLAYMDVPV
jgi:hypothetical protein